MFLHTFKDSGLLYTIGGSDEVQANDVQSIDEEQLTSTMKGMRDDSPSAAVFLSQG